MTADCLGLQSKLHPTSTAILRWLNINRMFRLKQLAVQHSLGPDGGIGDVITTLVQVVEHVEVASQNQRLMYAQDILACWLSEVAVFTMHVSRPYVSKRFGRQVFG